eukprot:11626601-Heterocapsa_arctica.AAC.1
MNGEQALVCSSGKMSAGCVYTLLGARAREIIAEFKPIDVWIFDVWASEGAVPACPSQSSSSSATASQF